MITVEESGMKFGPFETEQCWVVEKGAIYEGLGEGIKMVEFALVRHPVGKPVQVWLVEAKSSAPNPASAVPDAAERFAEFFADIRDKMMNALAVGIAARLGRHPAAEAELPEDWKALDLREMEFRFVLVVKGLETQWLPPLSEALNKSLRVVSRTWALRGNSAVVLNEELARRKLLIA